MNDKMWESPATQQALERLRSYENVTIIEPAEGPLACGTSGRGRMPEPELLLEEVISALTPKTLLGRHVLLTAGPTVERLDPVRYLSNFSTGKMGYALARECLRRGADVTLVSGPTSETLVGHSDRLRLVPVGSAQEMCQAAETDFPHADLAILCAAVADYRPEHTADHKLKKQGAEGVTLTLVQNPDILATLGTMKTQQQTLIGFALETDNELDNAQKKLKKKNLDYIVLNSLRDAGAGFGVDTNRVTILGRDGSNYATPLLTKGQVAEEIVKHCLCPKA
jgi:phosphopantothenoylcysteine decarboxylase/phosphopantothenate--cysteine ligase